VEDIPLLARHFLRHYTQESDRSIAAISDKAMQLLCAYRWPGNIRQLENAVEQAVALSNQPVLTPDDFPQEICTNGDAEPVRQAADEQQFLFPDTPTLEEVKKRYVLYILNRNQGNVSRTARVLNVDRRSLYRMLARYQVQPFARDG